MTVYPRNPYDAKIIEKMERCERYDERMTEKSEVNESQNDFLKPCPFCGAKAMLVYCVHGIGANWGVECTETHAHRMEFGGTQDEVIKEWNQRVKE